jgi:hypothetical protein
MAYPFFIKSSCNSSPSKDVAFRGEETSRSKICVDNEVIGKKLKANFMEQPFFRS